MWKHRKQQKLFQSKRHELYYQFVVVLLFLVGVLIQQCVCNTNLPPSFALDMNNLALSESTPVGEIVYRLEGTDPEDSPVHYGIIGTDRFNVDRDTGDVIVTKPLDREVNDTLTFLVTLEDEVANGQNNIVKVPINVIILDENDNSPTFKNVPYETTVLENTPVGSTVFQHIIVDDLDSVGETLEVNCSKQLQFIDACNKFHVVTLAANQSSYNGVLVLHEPLDYNLKPFYQLILEASDGLLKSTASVEIKIGDVQNKPPEFVGSLTGVVDENAPVNTLVMRVHAKDGDRGMPRKIVYELVTNPMDYFLLDPITGELRTAKPLDKEALEETTGVVTLTIRAIEVVDGVKQNDLLTMTTAEATVTIKDVNDEPPMFNQREYSVEIPENVPDGTPLPHLDMTVRDPDVGNNSVFSLRLEDISKAFTVEPKVAKGSTSVSIRVSNGSLDYENPNQRKFIILVIAEELLTDPKLSSTATVTVSITDANDNAPTFEHHSYSATVSETASAGSLVTTITAKDRDSGVFGENGIIYQLFGTGADRFLVNNQTGTITVAPCSTPGNNDCLDYETRETYFLTYKATDEMGKGQQAAVPLRISLLDSNDNAPGFINLNYRAVIDEGATKFDPELQVIARDIDKTSVIHYTIIGGNENNLFKIDENNGKISIANPNGLDMTNVTTDNILLTIEVSDGKFTNTCLVNITVRDVNNNAPVFVSESFIVSLPENAPQNSTVAQTLATDADTGINAQIKYHIQKGAFDAFSINETNGIITVASNLDYDRRNTYNIEIIGVDEGMPSLTGTTTLTVSILNVNDKFPYFMPSTQRAEISEDALPGTVVHTLTATDPDIISTDALNFAAAEPITAVDKNGKEVIGNELFKEFFSIDSDSGKVTVASPLQRDIAAVVRITVLVTDITAPTPQQAQGTLIITIVDVNDYPPVFNPPWTTEHPQYTLDLNEEIPIGSIVGSFTATDVDSNIANYEIQPESDYFEINNVTGVVKTKKLIDYEQVKNLNFTIIAFDSGVPQLNATALVQVNIINVNDADPVFEYNEYEGTVKENSPAGTSILTVHAVDGDDGEFGEVIYSLVGEHSGDFTIDPQTGVISVLNSGLLDREQLSDLVIQTVASDKAPASIKRTVTAQVHIKIQDVNDNPPVFIKHNYQASVVENLSLNPPSPILQVQAVDLDDGINSAVRYTIIGGNVGDVFTLDPKTGILYPHASLVGQPRHYHIVIEARDGDGNGQFTDKTSVDIDILDVNQYKPEFIMPALANATVEVPENAARADFLVMTVKAIDNDSGENGRITYHLKVGNKNIQETDEFIIDADTGELKTKMFLDREVKAKYELVLVAMDHGSPTRYETLRFLTVLLVDTNDNRPEFPDSKLAHPYRYYILENQPKDIRIGRVQAIDKDEGKHAKVYYYILSGNEDGSFYLDKSDGSLYTNKSFDREEKSDYYLLIIANNDPDYYLSPDDREKMSQDEINHDSSIAKVKVVVLDENDNAPKFQMDNYFAGVNVLADINNPIIHVTADDPDQGSNGTLMYYIRASNLYKYGSNKSLGSIIPSPFNVTQDGRLITANYMAEYNEGRFIVEVVAREIAYPEREAVANVHIWIYQPEQLIKVILSRPATEVFGQKEEIIAELSNATQSLVVVDEIRFHTDTSGRIHSDWSDMLIHVVDKQTNTIATIPEVLKLIDAKYDFLKDYYTGFAIENVVPVVDGVKEEPFDPALATLIALLIVLFVGIITFIVVCCCLKQWVLTIPNDLKKKDALIKKAIIDDLNTTENPLWIEQKLKLYEEQELTMQVFSEPDQQIQEIDNNRDNINLTPVDNTYATIQHTTVTRRNSNNTDDMADYATLAAAPPRAGSSNHSSMRGAPSYYEAALGFQGSTFQVPEPLESTTQSAEIFLRPPPVPRSTTNLTSTTMNSTSSLKINQDGQPEFVAELI